MLMHRRRRAPESGQALILALAVIAFFGLVTAAVLRLADTVSTQQSQAEATALQDANLEGAMYFAAEAGAEQPTCRPGQTGTMAMATGDTVSYLTKACSSSSGCSVSQDDVSVQYGSTTARGWVVIETQCSTPPSHRIVSVNYGP